MATIRQKKTFKAVVNGSTISAAMVKAGYSKKSAQRTNKVTRTKGWAELMEKELPDGFLAEKHRELLEKREIAFAYVDGKREKELIDQPDTNAVSKALDMAYKLKGRYFDKDVPINSSTTNNFVQIVINAPIKDGQVIESPEA